MDMTFQEKSILGSLTFTVVLFGYYFIKFFQLVITESSDAIEALPAVMIEVVVALIIVEASYHSIIAIGKKSAEPDEREQLIAARATQISYYVLVSVCIFAVGHLMFDTVFASAGRASILTTPLVSANLVLFAIILAEITGFGVQLFYLRRGF
jgi:hypothetical protein